jgi:hypothetical protein
VDPGSNQIYLVTFINTVAKWFFDSCKAEMAQSLSSLQKSEFLKLIILIFHVRKLNNMCELNVRPATFRFLEFFHFFPIFSAF